MTFLIKKILFPVLIFVSVFFLVLYFINNQLNPNQNSGYTLKAYKNTVALYSGDKIVNVYNDIVLNTLPKKDIQIFTEGIVVASELQAESYLEDFY